MPRVAALPFPAAPAKAARRTRGTAARELLALAAVLAFHLWTDSRQVWGKSARAGATIVTVAALGALLLRRQPTATELGFAPPSWTAGLGTLALGTGVAIAALLGAAAGRDWAPGHELRHWLVQVWLLEGLQQLLLHAVVRPRCAELFPRRPRTAALLAAGLFAALHFPNPALVPTTFVAALAWQGWFQRYRNLPALWATHLALGAALFAAWDGPWLRRVRVGIAWVYAPL